MRARLGKRRIRLVGARGEPKGRRGEREWDAHAASRASSVPGLAEKAAQGVNEKRWLLDLRAMPDPRQFLEPRARNGAGKLASQGGRRCLVERACQNQR